MTNTTPETQYPLGHRLKLTADIYDDGEDHHPPGYIGFKGEEVIVHGYGYAIEGVRLIVSHPDVTDGRSFVVNQNELEPASETTPLITTEVLQNRIQRIQAVSGDDAKAHVLEDRLREDFIKHIASLDLGELSEQAKLVLSTEEIDFDRWYE